MWTSRLAAFAVITLLAAGCERDGIVERPLLDGHHEPDVLVERARLERPPANSGNRFVRGWHPWKVGDVDTLVPGVGDAVVEIVHLKQRERRLTLRFAVFEPAPGTRVEVCLNGEPAFDVELTNPLEIPLPADLPPGRVAIALNCGGNPDPPGDGVAPLAVTEAVVRPAVPAGEVVFQPGWVVQAPWSAIDFVRKLEAPNTLLGRFRGPASSSGDFSIEVEGADGLAETVYRWPDDGEEIEVDLGVPAGLVRLRLVATGDGPPGRWEELRLVSREPAAKPAPAPPPAPRLVVLYVLDALRADALGHLGGVEGVSPTIDRMAAEGVTFTNHFSVAPNTMPSTKALFTGRAFRTKGGWKLTEEGGPTLAEAWLEAGYRTAAYSANAFVSYEFGLARGFEHAPRAVGEVDRSGRVASAQRVHRFGIRWLDALEAEDRGLLYLHTVHPHNPYEPPEPFLSTFTEGIDSTIDGSSRTLLDIKHKRIEIDAADQERLIGLYQGGLAYNDAELEKLMAVLNERYEPGEVLFVITSDHGEELFDHGGVLHGYTLYDEQLHIPLIFWWPGVLEPAKIDLPTDELDLHATLEALIAPDETDLGEGESLWPVLTGGNDDWPKEVRFGAASSLQGGLWMARSERAKLVWAPRQSTSWGMGQGLGRSQDPEYYFELDSDPEENVNLAGGPDLEVAWLRSLMLGWLEREKLFDLAASDPDEIDEETRRRLRALGYLD